MASLPNRRIVLGVTGGIAAYKSADLVRRLRDRGFEVRVVMTAAARAFVTPLTFQAVSSNPVHCDLLDEQAEAGMGHIELARWADLVLVAPATADVLARLAHGLADDLLTTLCLATPAPLAVAPAMNQRMWRSSATRANVQTLVERGVETLGPAEGDQACGDIGPGRMLEPEAIAERVAARFRSGALEGLGVLVTAGPTREPLDPVRFLTNHSSGRMGYAVAGAAVEAGARVSLVSGPTELATPPGLERIDVCSAEEMYAETMVRAPDCDIFIAAAAVADYRPARRSSRKIKKSEGDSTLELVRTPDIIARVAAMEDRPFTVGFAAETESVQEHARDKLERKGLDMIAANHVGLPDRGFAAEHNALCVLWRNGSRDLALAPKTDLARTLVQLVAERYRAEHPA